VVGEYEEIMLIKMQSMCMIGILLLAAVCVLAQSHHPDSLILNIGDIFDVDGINDARPLRVLANTIKANRSAKGIRLIWFSGAPNSGLFATSLYDRRTHTLRFYSKTTVGGLGNEGVAPQNVKWRLRNISDRMIIRLARNHQNHQVVEGSNDSFFSELTQFGAKRF